MRNVTGDSRAAAESTPAVTIGVPVYNGERYLAQTIDSLLAQTFEDFELLISNNASTDATEEICLEYARRDHRIRYFRQADNIGGSANYNFLVGETRGRYFKWAAADDLLAPDYLARCVEVLDRNSEYVLCHTRTITIGADGAELPNDIIRSSGTAQADAERRGRDYPPWQRYRDVLLGNGHPLFDTSVVDFYGVIRTEALRATELWRPFMGYEKVILARLSLQGRFWEVPERLFAYRVHPENASSQTSATAQQQWCDPQAKTKTYPRLQYLRGYVRGVIRSELPLGERVFCFLAIGRYLLQVKKWKRVFREIYFGQLFDGNSEILTGATLARDAPSSIDNPDRGWA